jgi:hypothetical protein
MTSSNSERSQSCKNELNCLGKGAVRFGTMTSVALEVVGRLGDRVDLGCNERSAFWDVLRQHEDQTATRRDRAELNA